MQSENKSERFIFAVLIKAAEGQYRHTLRGGFFQKCLKSSPGRGLIIFFPNNYLKQKSLYRTYRPFFTIIFLRATTPSLVAPAYPDGRALNTLRKAVFARLRRERRLTRNRRSALLHLQSNKNRNFSLLSPVESLYFCASYKKLVLIRMFLTTFSRKSVILSEVDFVRITAVVMLNIDLYYESLRKKFCNKWY